MNTVEENFDKATHRDLPYIYKYTEYLLDKVINCEKKHLFFNGLSHSEKEVYIESAIENKRRLKSLQVCFREVLKYQDSRFIEEARTYVTFKSRLYYLINILSIEKVLLNHAKSEAVEEKRKLKSQFDAKFQITTANVEIYDKQIVEENFCINSTDNNKIEIYPLYKVKGQTKLQEYNDSQSNKQRSCYIDADKDITQHKKPILHKDELENIVGKKCNIKKERLFPRLKSHKSSDFLQSELNGIPKSVKLKSDIHPNKHKNENIFLENIEGLKERLPVERLKHSNKMTKESCKKQKSIKSQVSRQSMQSLLKSLNLEIDRYEKQLRSVEKSLTFLITLPNSILFEPLKIDEIFAEVPVEEFLFEIEIHIKNARNSINSLQSVKDANTIMKYAINYFFNDSEIADVSANLFNGDIQKVKNGSLTANEIKDTPSLKDDAFELNSINEDKNNTPGELVILMKKQDIVFEIDNENNKVFELDGENLFRDSKSTKVVLNYEDQKVQISFIGNHIAVETENSEFDISFCKPQPVQILDDGTQTETIHNTELSLIF